MCLGNGGDVQSRSYGQTGFERAGDGRNDRKYMEGEFSYGPNLPFRNLGPRGQDKHRLLDYTKRTGGPDFAAKNLEANLATMNNSPQTGKADGKVEDTIPREGVPTLPQDKKHQSTKPNQSASEGPSPEVEDPVASNQVVPIETKKLALASTTESSRKWVMAEAIPSSGSAAVTLSKIGGGKHESKSQASGSRSLMRSGHKNVGQPVKSVQKGDRRTRPIAHARFDDREARLVTEKTIDVSSEDDTQIRESSSVLDASVRKEELDSASGGSMQDSKLITPENQPALEEMEDPGPWLTTFDNVHNTQDWSTAQEPSTTVEVASRPIHIIGHNKYGNFFAQSLANSGKSVIFLMSRPLAIQDWHDAGETVRLLRNGEIESTPGIAFEPAVEDSSQRNYGETIENPDTVIENLIVASHPGMMLASLRRVAHRLRPYSTVMFCENGLGIVDLVDKHVFPDPNKRPHYILANLDHDLREGRGRFDVAEARGGTLSCTKLPKVVTERFDEDSPTIQRKYFDWPASSKYLIGALLQAPDLNTKTLGHKSFHRQQLMNVAMHTLIDSVSVAFDVKCKDLLFNFSISQYMQKVLEEISRIICALPEIDTIPQAKRDFSVKRMQVQTRCILFHIGDRYTDFHADLREGKRRTGMNFYAGYLLGRAKEMNIQAPVLEALMLLVEGKQQYYSRKARSHIPFDFSAVRRVPSGQKADDGKV